MENNILIFLGVLVIALIFAFYFGYTKNSSSDTNPIEQKRFSEYFGICPYTNHFSTHKTDECNLSVVFESVFPAAIIDAPNSPMSFLVLSKYGSGKSLLRCLYLNNLQSSDYLKVLISTKELNEYLGRFVAETSTIGDKHEKEHSLIGWKKYEFAQMVLSASVTQFINLFNQEQFQVPKISLNEKLELLTIICYYYNDLSIDKLETFVNVFLDKSQTSPYKIDKIQFQVNEEGSNRDKSILTYFKRDLKKLSVISQDQKKLVLLLGIMESQNYQYTAVEKAMSEAVFQSLTQFTQFMKDYVTRPVVFVIDGLDENQYFFNENTANKLSLELFYRSSFSFEILSSVMAKNFYLALLYPDVQHVSIQEPVFRGEQLPTYTIEWNIKLLINYADYVIKHINQMPSTTRVKTLPNFSTLVNYDKPEIAAIIKHIQTPRALNFFMTELINEMNTLTNYVLTPLPITQQNITTAFQKSFENFHKRST
jgi:hypothetical protein